MDRRFAWLRRAAALLLVPVSAALLVAPGCAPGERGVAPPALPPQGDPGGGAPPIHLDSLVWVSGWKLRADDEGNNAYFGNAVAALGETLVVGAPASDAAYVFARSGAGWAQERLPVEGAGPEDRFGQSVAVSGHAAGPADTIVVGADNASVVGVRSGAAYVFTGSGTGWSQEAQLLPSDGGSYHVFGTSVAVWEDTIVAGATHADGDVAGTGAAYVFGRSGTGWSEEVKLVPSDGASSDYFGEAVAVAGDTVVVGAYEHAAHAGAAYVFARSGAGWSQMQELAGPGVAGSFGYSLAMSEDTLVVGAPDDDDEAGHFGAAYVFARSGPGWSAQAVLVARDGQWGSRFGYSVAVSADTIAVGTKPTPTVNGGLGPGSVYVFTRSGASWSQQQKILAADATPNEQLGSAVAVAGDAIFAGAVGDDYAGINSGATYVFVLRKEEGDACLSGDECASRSCADGVCCDQPCSDACDVCARSAGAVADGTCTKVAGAPGSPSCGAYLCDGTSSICPAACAADDGCAGGYRCAESGACEPGGPDGGTGDRSPYGCDASPAGAGGRPACLLAALVALAARARRRRR